MRSTAIVLLLTLVGCGGQATEPGSSATSTTIPDLPLGLSQAAFQGLVSDAADRAGVPVGEVEVVSIESQDFNDASLGCPEAGKLYAQVITPGFRVVVSADGDEYDYRVGQDSLEFTRCHDGDAP